MRVRVQVCVQVCVKVYVQVYVQVFVQVFVQVCLSVSAHCASVCVGAHTRDFDFKQMISKLILCLSPYLSLYHLICVGIGRGGGGTIGAPHLGFASVGVEKVLVDLAQIRHALGEEAAGGFADAT